MTKNARPDGRNVVRLTADELRQGSAAAQRRAQQLHDDVEAIEAQIHDSKREAQQIHRAAIDLRKRASATRKRAEALRKGRP